MPDCESRGSAKIRRGRVRSDTARRRGARSSREKTWILTTQAATAGYESPTLYEQPPAENGEAGSEISSRADFFRMPTSEESAQVGRPMAFSQNG